MPRLRVLAGATPTSLEDITDHVNASTPIRIATPHFDGAIAVNIKGFPDPSGRVRDSAYFEQADRQGVTWSIQTQGRFLRDLSADDVLFGNTFDRPLNLPWGFGPAIKFMSYMDPTLEHDLHSQTKPWALSPLISTMPYFAHRPLPSESKSDLPPFPPETPITDDLAHLPVDAKDIHTPAQRRAYFANPAHRKTVVFGPSDVLTTDFAYGYLAFSPALALVLPPSAGGFHFDLGQYWDGQPVRFVCCERPGTKGEVGRVFWCVSIELADDGDEDGDEEGGEGEGANADADGVD
ncbi:DUF1769-domain-containing protein [Athelia psychrophila]|uniref:DUF1769-domain-containing protein n=1 Tax=Athelia psychrophila TaxID=1759441 RepID=A0A167WRV5_9AGAM|nr:DUF1769-domain-containing protein [Fibularhizoctonia sp. CBS 109695]